jgi:transcriptional regulator with XRE-family HTH domain
MKTGPEKLGNLLKERRKSLGLTLENVEAATIRLGERVSAGFLSDTERAYPRDGGSVTLPSDEKLRALSRVLDIPLIDLHAAIGRIPAGALARLFVRETLARHGDQGSVELTESQMDALIDDIEEYANMRLSRTMRQTQETK